MRRAACGKVPPALPPTAEPDKGTGASRDGSLRWRWAVAADGSRSFTASVWTGKRFEEVVIDRVAAAG